MYLIFEVAEAYAWKIVALPSRRSNLVFAMFAAIAMREYAYFAALNDKEPHRDLLEYFTSFDLHRFGNKTLLDKMDNFVEKIGMNIESDEYDAAIITESYHESVSILRLYFHFFSNAHDSVAFELASELININISYFSIIHGLELKTALDVDRVVASAEFEPYLAEMDEMIALSADEAKVADFIHERMKEPSLFCPAH